MITHPRILRVGKTLNYRIDVSGNLDDPLTSASVTAESGLITIGAIDFETNPVTFEATGDAAGAEIIHISYASGSESDCDSIKIIVEEC